MLSSFTVLLYICVWYGTSVVYSIQLQQFLAVADSHSGNVHPVFEWRVLVTCVFVVTLQAACCSLLDGSALYIQHLLTAQQRPHHQYALVASSDSLVATADFLKAAHDADASNSCAENETDNEHDHDTDVEEANNDSVASLRSVDLNKQACSSPGPIHFRSLDVVTDLSKPLPPTPSSTVAPSRSLWLPNSVFTSRTMILTAYSGFASLLQTSSLQLSGILCFNSVRAVEPAMAASYARVAHGDRLAWTSVLGLLMVTAACIATLSDKAACSVLGGDSGRAMLAVLCGLIINCCMIGRNSLVQMLRVPDAEKYRQSRLEESATYYLQLLAIMLLLSAVVCSTALGRDLYTIWLSNPATLTLVVSSSAMFAAYNHCSLLVCERVDLVTHSILTIFKRPVLILASTLYLEQRVSHTALIVCLFTTLGLVLHMRGRSTAEKGKEGKQQEPSGSNAVAAAIAALLSFSPALSSFFLHSLPHYIALHPAVDPHCSDGEGAARDDGWVDNRRQTS